MKNSAPSKLRMNNKDHHDEVQIASCYNELNINKSGGYDNISAHSMKISATTLAPSFPHW